MRPIATTRSPGSRISEYATCISSSTSSSLLARGRRHMLIGMAIRVVVADDSYLIREAVAQLLELRDDIELVASCEDLRRCSTRSTRMSRM